MMNVRKWSRIFSIFSLLLIVMFKFQNCAPTRPGEEFSSQPSGEVRIVDQWAPSKVEFLSPSYLIETTVQEVNVPGLCVGAPKGQRLVWQLLDTKDHVIIESGIVECLMGNFQLTINKVAFNDCKTELELKAQKEESPEPPAITILRPYCG